MDDDLPDGEYDRMFSPADATEQPGRQNRFIRNGMDDNAYTIVNGRVLTPVLFGASHRIQWGIAAVSMFWTAALPQDRARRCAAGGSAGAALAASICTCTGQAGWWGKIFWEAG